MSHENDYYISIGSAYPVGHSNPLVSVVIPVYNVERYLRECLDSVIDQDLRELEIICVDDGSTDGSLDILKEYQSRDARISVISKPNEGPSVSRNIGMHYARGKYLQFLDSDDYLAKEALGELYRISEEKGLDALLYDFVRFFDGDEKSLKDSFKFKRREYADIYDGPTFLKTLKDENAYITSPCHIFFRSDFLIGNEIYFYKGILHEDELFCFYVFMKAERISHTARPFYYRRVRNGSIMRAPKSHKNVLGYFISMQEVLRCGLSVGDDPIRLDESWRAYRQLQWQSRQIYALLGSEERNKLQFSNPFSQVLFDTQVASSGGISIDTGGDDLSQLSPDALRERIIELTALASHYEQTAESLRTSASYKIGGFITWLPRKLSRAWKCFRENGLRFTISRIIKN